MRAIRREICNDLGDLCAAAVDTHMAKTELRCALNRRGIKRGQQQQMLHIWFWFSLFYLFLQRPRICWYACPWLAWPWQLDYKLSRLESELRA